MNRQQAVTLLSALGNETRLHVFRYLTRFGSNGVAAKQVAEGVTLDLRDVLDDDGLRGLGVSPLRFRQGDQLGPALWVFLLVVFLPIVGWGFLGLAVGPRLIVAFLINHLLFALFAWALCRWGLGSTSARHGDRSADSS